MYKDLIDQLKYYAKQKQETAHNPLGALVKHTILKEADTLLSAAQAIEALIAGQESLQEYIAKLEEKLKIAQEANRRFLETMSSEEGASTP